MVNPLARSLYRHWRNLAVESKSEGWGQFGAAALEIGLSCLGELVWD